jgi:PleD family two-component response regulator
MEVCVRILVVDSDPVAAEDLARKLGAEHKASAASNSEGAMLSVCRHRPRLVLFQSDARLSLAERMLKAMSQLGDLRLVIYDATPTKEEIARVLGDCL